MNRSISTRREIGNWPERRRLTPSQTFGSRRLTLSPSLPSSLQYTPSSLAINMEDLRQSLTRVALNPAYHDILTVAKVSHPSGLPLLSLPDSRYAHAAMSPSILTNSLLPLSSTSPQAARNGAVYGAKIRFPHALVMTFLFGRGTPQEKFKFILTATKNHSLNLMKFASLYKSLMIVMRRTNSGKERSLDSFVAGVVGGWIVFGERTTVNEQVRGPYT